MHEYQEDLSLALLMAGIAADNAHYTLAADYPAILAYPLYRCLDFHLRYSLIPGRYYSR